MLIHFIRNGPSYLPEIDAYCAYIQSHGHQTMVHDSSVSVPASASVVWWFCGRVPMREAHRLRGAFQIHEYASASIPPHAWLKDQVKHWTLPRPDYRIYQNGWVRERMGFADGVPHALRDMGLAEHFFEAPLYTTSPEFDLVYLGEMSRLLAFIPVLQAINAAGRSLLLVGDVPEALQTHLPPNVTCTGRVAQPQVPQHLRRVRFGLNLVPNAAPFQQQTSTKVLEYCAVGLRVVSNAYPWVRYFMAQHKANFYLLRDDPSSLATSFGESLYAYPYEVPDVRALAWPQVLDSLPPVAHDTAMNITSKIVALSSAVAFALQIALALLMLRYFSPEEVGMFSVISQIGFFWTTLALAQAPLQLLANHGNSVLDDARLTWISSMQRFFWLLPVAALAVWCSGLSFVNALLWALLLSLCQLTWMLAQSMRLRMVHPWAQVGVRVLPPLMALLVATAAVYMQWDGPALLTAALLGYAIGASWLLPALLTFCRGKFDEASTKPDELALSSTLQDPSQATTASVFGDNRSAALRMAHTLTDALLATAIVVVWQRLYGAQETGWLAAPLRVMGFVPAVVHMAWAQVLLAQPQHARTNPLWVGLGGFACVALLGAGCAIALETGWLGEQWRGVWPYLWPLVVWQGSACLVAAFSHLPFQAQYAREFSWMCMAAAILQGTFLLAPVLTRPLLTSSNHMTLFAGISATSFCAIYLRLRQFERKLAK